MYHLHELLSINSTKANKIELLYQNITKRNILNQKKKELSEYNVISPIYYVIHSISQRYIVGKLHFLTIPYHILY